MQGGLSTQIFTTKNIFCSKLIAEALVSLMPKARASLASPYYKYSPSSPPFRTFHWTIKNQDKSSPTVSARFPETILLLSGLF
jgi:hypothetical protein